jgi:hypothetical protein
MVRREETHEDRFRRNGRIAILCGATAWVCFRYAHRPLSPFALLAFAGGVLGGLTAVIMSAGSYVLHVIEKRKRNG